MLVLSRKVGERIHVGNDIILEIRRITGNRVTLALDAPRNVRILRGDVGALVSPVRFQDPGLLVVGEVGFQILHDAITVLDQVTKCVEHTGLHRDGLTVAPELASAPVKLECVPHEYASEAAGVCEG